MSTPATPNAGIPDSASAHASIKQLWEQGWSRADYDPPWRISSIPEEVERAAGQWFQPGARLLDIGCGEGEISFYLADRGFDVVAFDYSPAAVERALEAGAKAAKGEKIAGGNPRFLCLDICEQSVPGPPYQALLDRGCLHGMLKEMYPHYARRVAAAASVGARFLMLYALHHRPGSRAREDEERMAAEATERIREVFGPYFTLDDARTTTMEKKPRPVTALSVWMTRRES